MCILVHKLTKPIPLNKTKQNSFPQPFSPILSTRVHSKPGKKNNVKMETTYRRKLNFLQRHSKPKTNKITDRLTYNPKKHKQKAIAALRQKLQQKKIKPAKPVTLPSVLKFGSFNVNGLDLEAAWAVEQLLKQRGFDVSLII